MRFHLGFASILQGIESRAYSIISSWSVYVGLVRVSLQEKLPLLAKHQLLALATAVLVVVGVQFLIGLLSVLTIIWNAAEWSITSIQAWMHAFPIPSFLREER